MKDITIGIAGAGGLGSNVASSLVRSGFKKFIIVDYDKVEASNLNRQFFFLKDIGRYKVDALLENLNLISDDLLIEIHKEKISKNNINTLFSKVDILIEALDNPKDKAILVNTFLKDNNKTVIAASGIAGYSSSNNIKTKKINNNFYLVGDNKSCKDTINNNFLAPRVLIAANHQANIVLQLVNNKEAHYE